ncbi:MAG: hypothetical protein WB919_19890 [Candidatus Sulfotelmatobacter sp.]
MTSYRQAVSFIFVHSVILLLLVPVLAAESKQTPAPAAPVPARILTAKKIFVANAGQDERSTDEPIYNGGPDRAYNELYAELKTWGRYELTSDPSDADLVFEIRFTIGEPVIRQSGVVFPSPYDPEFRLTIRDPKTNVLLWSITEHAEWAILQGNRDKNFDLALVKVVDDVQALSGQPADSASGRKQ